MNHIKTGEIGEDLAVKYIKKHGYKVLGRNFRKIWGEIDIVAKDKENRLIFIEVKTIRQRNPAIANEFASFYPEDHFNSKKIFQMKKCCTAYVNKNENLLDENVGWRVDLAAITIFNNGESDIRYYENVI